MLSIILNYLNRSKFKISLVVLNIDNQVFLERIPKDVKLINLKKRRLRFGIFKIVLTIWRENPDLVFSNLTHLNLLISFIKPFFPKKMKFIARESNILSQILMKNKFFQFWKLIYRFFYKNFDLVICQSNFMEKDLIKTLKIPLKNSIVIPNPIDFKYIEKKLNEKDDLEKSKNNFDKNKIKFLSVGRLSKEKGFDLLIEAVSYLDEINFDLTILGEGKMKPQLEKKIKRFNLSDKVFLRGFQENPFIWYKNSDALIVSSRYEAFPNVVLESLACDRPVIATPAVGGIKEIFDNLEECFLAESISAVSLAQALKDWISKRRLISYKNSIKSYDASFIIGLYEKELIKILNKS